MSIAESRRREFPAPALLLLKFTIDQSAIYLMHSQVIRQCITILNARKLLKSCRFNYFLL